MRSGRVLINGAGGFLGSHTTEAFAEAGEKAKEAVDPISDFRGSAGYKKDMAAVFVRRALEQALGDLRQKSRSKVATKAVKKKPMKKGKRR